jgi:hypothetical protein
LLTSEEAERAARVAQEQDLVAEKEARAKQELATAEALREVERLRRLLARRGA